MNLPPRTAIFFSLLLAAGASFAGGRRHAFYSPESALLAETAQTNAAQPPIEQEYVWFGDRPVAQFDGATQTARFTFGDHLAAPLIQTAATGEIVWRAEYEPYGAVHAFRAGAPLRQPLRFAGQEAPEAGSGGSYNIQRWYRPDWSVYTQPDPLGEDGEAHLYLYVDAHPLTSTDPLGLYEVRGGTDAQKQQVHHAMQRLQDYLSNPKRKKRCDPCRAYFANKALGDLDTWTQPGGKPIINIIHRPPHAEAGAKAHSNVQGQPYMHVYDDNFKDKPDLCLLASIIMHEAGHLARGDGHDNEPEDFFKACKLGCAKPGRFR